MSSLVIALLVVVGVVAVAIPIARYIESKLMYRPSRERVSPEAAGLGDVEEIELPTGKESFVLAWWGKAAPGRPTLLYFHGNGGSLDNRADRLRKYLDLGHGVFMMTYRGYGGSTGSPSERANVADAKRAYDWLVAHGVARENIVLYGESIGSGVAVQVAADKRVGGLILDAPYTSILEVAGLLYPYLPSRIFLRDRYDTMRYIGRIKAPLLVVHGEADEVIPVEMGRAVYNAAPEPKEIATFRGARHSDHGLFGSFDAIQAWLAGLYGAEASQRRIALGGRR